MTTIIDQYNIPNQYNNIVGAGLASTRYNIKLDEFIIMPNHIHGIINTVAGGRACPAL